MFLAGAFARPPETSIEGVQLGPSSAILVVVHFHRQSLVVFTVYCPALILSTVARTSSMLGIPLAVQPLSTNDANPSGEPLA